MRRLFLSTLLLFWCAPTLATSYYFSDCASGGAGTVGDPYCLINAKSATKRTSFAYALDSADGNHAAADDIILLCAGVCDGAGTGTYNLESRGNDGDGHATGILVSQSGTSGHPIIVQPYCTGGTCETVTLSGDADADGHCIVSPPSDTSACAATGSGTDLAHVISARVGSTGGQWITIDGDPIVTGTRHLTIKQSVRIVVDLNLDPSGWVIKNTRISNNNREGLWRDAGVDLVDAGCPRSTAEIDLSVTSAIKVKALTGTCAFTNNQVDSICGSGFRATDNPTAAALMFDGNRMFNIYSANNDYNNSNTTWQNNVIDSYAGLAIEDRNKHLVIQDNTFYCGNTYKVSNTSGTTKGICAGGINVNNGDNGAAFGDQCYDIVVRRNRVYGTTDQGTAPNFGAMEYPLRIVATCNAINTGCLGDGNPWSCCAGAHPNGGNTCDCNSWSNPYYTVENNFVWYALASLPDSSVERSGILLASTQQTLCQNNTVYQANNQAIYAAGTSHVIKNNIIAVTNTAASSPVALKLAASATGSTVTNNDIWDTGGGSVVVVNNNGTTYTCTNIGTFGTANICSAPALVDVSSSDKGLWNLHLSGAQACIDAGTSGAADDIDKQNRSGTLDIGADEIVTSKISGKVAVSGKVAIQ